MQFCDLHTLLHLARCSSTTLASACAPVAWRGLSPLLLRTNVAPSPPLVGERIAQSRLLRHCDIALRWEHAECEPELFTDQLRDVMCIPRLHSFLLPHTYQWSSGQWKQFFSTTTFQQHLCVLRTNDPGLQECDSALLLQQAPLLHTLQFVISYDSDWSTPADYAPPLLAALPLLPHLTDVRVMACREVNLAPALSIARHLGHCARLRVLHLSDASTAFVCAVLSAGGLKCIQHLRLSDIDARNVAGSEDDDSGQCSNWRSAVQALAASGTLRTLTLHHVQGINPLLEHAPLLVASLQLVRVDRSSALLSFSPSRVRSAPSAHVLNMLLFALPVTQFVLNLPVTGGHFSPAWLVLASQWNALSTAHPRQLTILTGGVHWAADEPTDDIAF
jgi:hypothetical protein